MVFAMAGIVEFLYLSWEVWRAYWAHGELHAVDGLVKNPRNALSYWEMGTDRHGDFEMHSVGVRDRNQFQNIPTTHLKSSQVTVTKTKPYISTFTFTLTFTTH